MCRYHITLRGCKHPRIATRHTSSCLRSCNKSGANETKEGKCTKCAGKKRGSLSRKVGGTKKPSARLKFVTSVRDQKKKQPKAAAAAAATATAAQAALAAAPIVQQSGNANAQTVPHVRVVKR
jgi:hypothetical protein